MGNQEKSISRVGMEGITQPTVGPVWRWQSVIFYPQSYSFYRTIFLNLEEMDSIETIKCKKSLKMASGMHRSTVYLPDKDSLKLFTSKAAAKDPCLPMVHFTAALPEVLSIVSSFNDLILNATESQGGGSTMSGEQEPRSYYVGVDVGTGSVRAALVDQRGVLLAFADQPIKKWEPQFNHHEQSSADIWAACCVVTKKVVQGIDVNQIRGLGFDATCSLVVLDKQFRPLPVNQEACSVETLQVLHSSSREQKVSLESGGLAMSMRSLCSLVCKWTYSAEKGWDDSFWEMIGLEDFVADNYNKIGNQVLPPGTSLGSGLTLEAAKELGLPTGVPVAVSLIDAHAGGLGNLSFHATTSCVQVEHSPDLRHPLCVFKAKVKDW
ncbi:FGGY carbohydrate kinase domain-containing protein [Sciurus carolinensis]|uniref:FGGY carbohydrate kinase domain-containing protein n=1 Tax=Sciurus carolinensis TaxID=30640 RepID=A0AA41NKD3_SCICA|nr:FGGY carbohydrate kinase domain-containing protein [Sciurus carolinensis]